MDNQEYKDNIQPPMPETMAVSKLLSNRIEQIGKRAIKFMHKKQLSSINQLSPGVFVSLDGDNVYLKFFPEHMHLAGIGSGSVIIDYDSKFLADYHRQHLKLDPKIIITIYQVQDKLIDSQARALDPEDIYRKQLHTDYYFDENGNTGKVIWFPRDFDDDRPEYYPLTEEHDFKNVKSEITPPDFELVGFVLNEVDEKLKELGI